MKRSETVFDYLKQILIVFGFTVLCLTIFCALFGEDAQSYSTIFELGNKGLSLSTILQFFLLSVIIITLKFIYFTDGLIKRVSIVIRTFLMFFFVILITVFFTFWFGWFPVNVWKSWAIFFLCLAVCCYASAYLMAWKEKLENQKMEEALQRLKEGENKHDN